MQKWDTDVPLYLNAPDGPVVSKAILHYLVSLDSASSGDYTQHITAYVLSHIVGQQRIKCIYPSTGRNTRASAKVGHLLR